MSAQATSAPAELVPMLDLRPEVEGLWGELTAAIHDVLRSGRFIIGPNVDTLEKEIAAKVGLSHAVGVNSGTDALVIGLRALGVKPGDEVITTPFTFFATAEAISSVGAVPVFVDIEPDTYNLNAELTEAAITERTKAIIPVHLYGQACDMDAFVEIAERRHVPLLEDVAQAFAATWRGCQLGSFGAAAALSFFPSKTLGAYGDGGMLLTGNPEVARTATMLRFHGSERKYHNELLGYNSRLDEMQAAILRVKLRHVEASIGARRAIALQYDARLAKLDGVTVPVERPEARHAYHQYTVRIEGGRRDAVAAYLKQAGVASMVYYPRCMHDLPVYRHMRVDAPVSDLAAQQVLSLPMGHHQTPEQTRMVLEAMEAALARPGNTH